jgi:hypothetical protein
VSHVDWNEIDLTALAGQVRRGSRDEDAERIVVAFEHAVALARADEAFLDDLLVAVVCLLAHAEGTTPREILERYFRRAMADQRWRAELAPLLAGGNRSRRR